MAKSNTLEISTVEQMVAQAVSYFKNWSEDELTALIAKQTRSNQMPFIAPIGKNGYVVGNYAVRLVDNNWWEVHYRFSDTVHVFTSKLAAICYAVYSQTGKDTKADVILKNDAEVSKLTIKSENFYFRFKQAQKKKDQQKIDLFLVRYQESAGKLTLAKSNLEKSLNSAKYIKF
jgi:hypothetical protein